MLENVTKRDTVPFYQSKTVIASTVCAIAAAFPGVQAFVAANPAACTATVGLLFGLLRVLTNKPVAARKKKA